MTMTMTETTEKLERIDRCVQQKNKKIFATRVEAEDFEKRNREKYGTPQQYAYDCPHGDHVHLSSTSSYVSGAPQVKTTNWSHAKAAWQVIDPELPATKGDKILAALRRHNGSKTVKEIAAECGIADTNLTAIYDIAKDHDLPYLVKRSFGRMAQQPPITLQNVRSRREQMEAELKQLDELEKGILKQEEEKRRVTVKVATNGNNGTTMIFAGACGTGVWLDANSKIGAVSEFGTGHPPHSGGCPFLFCRVSQHGPVKEQTCFCTCYNLAPMPSIQSIVAELIQERDRISQAIAALESIDGSTRTAGRPSTGGKRIVSAVSRRRMSAAQRARWAKVKSQSKPATSLTIVKRTMSASARRKIAAAQRARWARVKKAA